MHITVNRQALLAACAVANPCIVPHKTDKDFPANFLYCDGKTLQAIGLYASCALKMQPEEDSQPGACLLPGEHLAKTLAALATPTVTLESNSDGAMLTSGLSVFEFVAPPADQFPLPAPGTEKQTAAIPASHLNEALDTATFSAKRRIYDGDPWQGMLGVQLSVKDGTLTVATCNGPRLVLAQHPVDGGDWKHLPIIHRKAIDPLEQFLDGLGEELVTLGANSRHLNVRSPGSVVSCSLVTGRFPDWMTLIPTDFAGQVTLPSGQLRSCMRSSTCLKQPHKPRHFELSFSPEKILFSGLDSYGAARAIAEIPCPVAYSAKFDVHQIQPFLDRLSIKEPVTLHYGSKQHVLLLESGNARCQVASLSD